MGESGESTGARVQGEIIAVWCERKSRFATYTQWVVRDARGEVVEIISRSSVSHLEDDEWLDRNVTRRARAMFAETRSYTEERRDGVQRMF